MLTDCPDSPPSAVIPADHSPLFRACADFAGEPVDPAQVIAAEHANLGGLLADRFYTARANPPADAEAGDLNLRYRLDEAISVLSRALALIPESTDDWRQIAALADSLHYDRYIYAWSGATAQNRADLDSAIELLLKAVTTEGLDHDGLTALVLALMDRSDLTTAPGDLDAVIDYSRRLLDDPDIEPEQAGDFHNLRTRRRAVGVGANRASHLYRAGVLDICSNFSHVTSEDRTHLMG